MPTQTVYLYAIIPLPISVLVAGLFLFDGYSALYDKVRNWVASSRCFFLTRVFFVLEDHDRYGRTYRWVVGGHGLFLR
jgi:hypothetical protein